MDIKNYLVHCYLYYELNESIISDEDFDRLCVRLLANWPNQQSSYKKYISKNDLEAGTGFTLFYDHETNKRDYPSEIVTLAETKLVNHRAHRVLTYRVTTNDPEMLYLSLKDAEDWFLLGLEIDYTHFLKDDKKKMALGVIERIWKERKKDEPKNDSESGTDPAIA
jgi:hypothetical protein